MSKFVDIWLPTRIEVLIYSIISAVVIVAMNMPVITDLFIDPDVARFSVSIFQEQLNNFLGLIDSLSFTSTLVLALFWGTLGLVLYVAGYTFFEVYLETRNDIVDAVEFHHPAYFKANNWLLQALGRIGLRALAAIGLVSLSIVIVGYILPVSAQLGHDVVYVRERPTFIANPFFGIAFLAVSLHLFLVLTRFLLLRNRLSEELEPEV